MKRLREPDPQTDELARLVIGAAIEVHKHLGPGFLEKIYEEALCVELKLRGIPFTRQALVHVEYKGVSVGEGRIDLLVGDRLVAELKATRELAPVHKAVVLSYLKTTGRTLALLINFRTTRLADGVQRIVLSS